MIKNVDAAIVSGTSATERIECAFELNSCEEEDAALDKLQIMLLNVNSESIDEPFECMGKLVGLFKGCVFESDPGHPICVFSWCRTKDGIATISCSAPECGYGVFRFGKLPNRLFSKEEIPGIIPTEFFRIIVWNYQGFLKSRIIWDMPYHEEEARLVP